MHPRIESIQVGRTQTYENGLSPEKPWTSAIDKRTLTGGVFAGLQSLSGDEQSDLIHHGGADKAILAYAIRHYDHWRSRYPEANFCAGGFGENLTVSGVCESSCCVGDVVEVGTCLLEISQPRQPCWKLSRRWGIEKLEQAVQAEYRTGWYLRVLRPGTIQAGDKILLRERRHPEFTVARALAVMYAKPRNPQNDLDLASLPELSQAWKTHLFDRSAKSE